MNRSPDRARGGDSDDLRANGIAAVSPRGGVGKTASATPGLAIDSDLDYGPLAGASGGRREVGRVNRPSEYAAIDYVAGDDSDVHGDDDRLVPVGRPAPAPPPPEDAEPDEQEELQEDGPITPQAEERPGRGRPARPRPILRSEVYTARMEAGRELRETPLRRLAEQLRRLLTSRGERLEVELDQRLRTLPRVSRTNVIAVVSPRGGVGKTTLTYVVGSTIADYARRNVVAIDSDVDYGPLADLASDSARSERNLAGVLDDFETRPSLSELQPYLSDTPTGLRLLAAPTDERAMARLRPADCDRLLELLGNAEIVIIDCAAGINRGLASWAISRADQILVVTKPDWVASNNVARSLKSLPLERVTLALNQARKGPGDREAIERHFGRHELDRLLLVPFDQQLANMLDSASYALPALRRSTRVAIKQVAATMGEELR